MALKLTIFIIALISVAFCYCPAKDYPFMKNFDPQEIQGDWYVLKRYVKEAVRDYNKVEYEWLSENAIIRIVDTYIEDGYFKFRLFPTYENPKFPKQGSYFTNQRDGNVDFTNGYNFVATDYDNYAIIIHCKYLDIEKLDYVILARDKMFNVESHPEIREILAKEGISLDELYSIQQSKLIL